MLHWLLPTGYRQIDSDFKITAHVYFYLLTLPFPLSLNLSFFISPAFSLCLSSLLFSIWNVGPVFYSIFFQPLPVGTWFPRKFSRTGILNIVCLYTIFTYILYIYIYFCIYLYSIFAKCCTPRTQRFATPTPWQLRPWHKFSWGSEKGTGSRQNSHSENARALSFFGGPVKRLITRIRLTVSTFPVSIMRS